MAFSLLLNDCQSREIWQSRRPLNGRKVDPWGTSCLFTARTRVDVVARRKSQLKTGESATCRFLNQRRFQRLSPAATATNGRDSTDRTLRPWPTVRKRADRQWQPFDWNRKPRGHNGVAEECDDLCSRPIRFRSDAIRRHQRPVSFVWLLVNERAASGHQAEETDSPGRNRRAIRGEAEGSAGPPTRSAGQ